VQGSLGTAGRPAPYATDSSRRFLWALTDLDVPAHRVLTSFRADAERRDSTSQCLGCAQRHHGPPGEVKRSRAPGPLFCRPRDRRRDFRRRTL